MSVQLMASRAFSRTVFQIFSIPETFAYGVCAGSRWCSVPQVYARAGAGGGCSMATEAARHTTSEFRGQGRRGDRRTGQPGRGQRNPSDGFDRYARPAELEDFMAASSVLIEKGPTTMQKEDILDLCARHDIFIAPEQMKAVYRRNASTVLFRLGWKLDLPNTADRKRAHALSTRDTRVGAHKVNFWPENSKDDRVAGLLVQLAEESKGRYLLMTNLPGSCSKHSVQHIFKGSKMLDCNLQESTNTVVMFDTTGSPNRERHGAGRGRRRPGAHDAWSDAGAERDPNHRRAAIVKFASSEDAFLAWRSHNHCQHTFPSENVSWLLKCRVLE